MTQYQYHVLVLERRVKVLSADMQRLMVQTTVHKDLLEGVRTAPALHKMAYRQRVSTFFKKREKLSADEAVVETSFS